MGSGPLELDAKEVAMVHSVKKVSGWISGIGIGAWALLGVLRVTPLGRWLPDDLGKAMGAIGMVSFFFVFLAADAMIEEEQRPSHLRRLAPTLGLTYVSDDASGLPSQALRRFVPGSPKYVMVGSHDGRQLVACLGVYSDPDGSDYMWCAMVELPITLPDMGIRVRRSEIRPCRDWPSRKGFVWPRERDISSAHREIFEDPGMRDWLLTFGSRYHFHIHDRWVMCRGPNVSLASFGMSDRIGQVVDAAKGFVDHLPEHLLWRQKTARPGSVGGSSWNQAG